MFHFEVHLPITTFRSIRRIRTKGLSGTNDNDQQFHPEVSSWNFQASLFDGTIRIHPATFVGEARYPSIFGFIIRRWVTWIDDFTWSLLISGSRTDLYTKFRISTSASLVLFIPKAAWAKLNGSTQLTGLFWLLKYTGTQVQLQRCKYCVLLWMFWFGRRRRGYFPVVEPRKIFRSTHHFPNCRRKFKLVARGKNDSGLIGEVVQS